MLRLSSLGLLHFLCVRVCEDGRGGRTCAYPDSRNARCRCPNKLHTHTQTHTDLTSPFIRPSIHPSIYPSLSIHQSIRPYPYIHHPSIHPFISHPPFHPAAHPHEMMSALRSTSAAATSCGVRSPARYSIRARDPFTYGISVRATISWRTPDLAGQGRQDRVGRTGSEGRRRQDGVGGTDWQYWVGSTGSAGQGRQCWVGSTRSAVQGRPYKVVSTGTVQISVKANTPLAHAPPGRTVTQAQGRHGSEGGGRRAGRLFCQPAGQLDSRSLS